MLEIFGPMLFRFWETGWALGVRWGEPHLYSTQMELFLNLTWFFLSLALVAWWVRSPALRPGKGKTRVRVGWTALVALGVLLLLLLPAISMTDDLQAINMPAEFEHGLRQAPVSLLVGSLLLMDAVPPRPDGLGIRNAGLLKTRVDPPSFAATVRSGFVRAVGTRPPTEQAS